MKGATRYFEEVARLLAAIAVTDRHGRELGLDDGTERAVAHLLQVRSSGRKVILVGNGGSAAIAGHMEMDLCNRVGLRAHVFNDPPVLTALANDHGYEGAFQRMIELWGEPDDCLIAISSSGRSPNIHRAVHAARAAATSVITFSGFAPDNGLRRLGDYNFHVASSEYGEVEVAHHALGHFLTDCAAAAVAAGNESGR